MSAFLAPDSVGGSAYLAPDAPPSSGGVTGVAVSPSSATVAGGATQAFSATVSGTSTPSQSVTWGATSGSIDSDGLFTAPAAGGVTQSVTVTATSVQDTDYSGVANVTIPSTSSGSTGWARNARARRVN